MENIVGGEVENKLQAFTKNTQTRKTLFLTLITTYGVAANEYKTGLVQNELTMDALFT